MSKEHFQYHGRSISFLFYISFDREIENLLKELTAMVIYISTKSFEISLEGEGSKLKGFVTERRKGFVSWIQLGEAGSKNHLKGVETIRKEDSKVKRIFNGKENGRSCRLENCENERWAGFFFSRSLMVMEEGTDFSSLKVRVWRRDECCLRRNSKDWV